MAQLSTSSDTKSLILSLLLDNLLYFIYFLTSHPLYLAYFLFFSPYLFPLLSFLLPLLLSTSLTILLLTLHSKLQHETTQLGSLVLLATNIGNVFEWEFEAMGELYKNLSLNCEDESDPVEISLVISQRSELLESHFGVGHQVITLKGSSFDPEKVEFSLKNSEKSEVLKSNCGIRAQFTENLDNGKHLSINSEVNEGLFEWEVETMGEFCKNLSLNCEDESDPVEISLENLQKSELLESHFGVGHQVTLKDGSFEPENLEVSEDPVEFSLKNSEKSEVLKSSLDNEKHLSTNSDVNEGSVELSLKLFDESEVLKSNCGIGDQFCLKDGSLRPENSSKMAEDLEYWRTNGEFFQDLGLNCEVNEDPVHHSLNNSKRGEFLDSRVTENVSNSSAKREESKGRASESPQKDESNCEISKPHLGFGDEPVSKDTVFKPKSLRMLENLNNSPSIRIKELEGRPWESLQRDGSMRKEKEWKRTLACKLYEERMTFKLCEDRTVAEGGEEMDLLWEAYEADASKTKNLKNKERFAKKEECKEEEEYEEEEEMVRQLCCLQALRLSAGKMNLGVGRPNLMKISKVFKGMGLFRRSGGRSRKS